MLKSVTLSPELSKILNQKHPWMYRKKVYFLSKTWKDGERFLLESYDKKDFGMAIYSSKGLIALRFFYWSNSTFQEAISLNLDNAIRKRLSLQKITNSFRWIHGENDSFPGITIDNHNDLLVIQVYSHSVVSIARYISILLYSKLLNNPNVKIKPKAILLKSPRRTSEEIHLNRVLRGEVPTNILIQYRGIEYTINPLTGKTGIYNDIRNLRNYIYDNPNLVKGKIVLNLFSNNGLLSECFIRSGANIVYSLEDSQLMVDIHKKNIGDSDQHRIFQLDIFKKLSPFLKEQATQWDCIVIDPPSLTSSEKDKENARKIYSSLIQKTLPYLKEEGFLICCSCSNRIHENDFSRICIESIKALHRKYKLLERLKEEPDHPIIDTFPEGKYFKVHIYKVYK